MNLKLSPEQLDAIEQREQNATPGEWIAEYNFGNGYVRIADRKQAEIYGDSRDADFIAASRTDVPNLVHDWRVLSQRVQELERVLEWYAGPAFSQTHNAAGLRQPYPILEDEGHKAREVLNKK